MFKLEELIVFSRNSIMNGISKFCDHEHLVCEAREEVIEELPEKAYLTFFRNPHKKVVLELFLSSWTWASATQQYNHEVEILSCRAKSLIDENITMNIRWGKLVPMGLTWIVLPNDELINVDEKSRCIGKITMLPDKVDSEIDLMKEGVNPNHNQEYVKAFNWSLYWLKSMFTGHYDQDILEASRVLTYHAIAMSNGEALLRE